MSITWLRCSDDKFFGRLHHAAGASHILLGRKMPQHACAAAQRPKALTELGLAGAARSTRLRLAFFSRFLASSAAFSGRGGGRRHSDDIPKADIGNSLSRGGGTSDARPALLSRFRGAPARQSFAAPQERGAETADRRPTTRATRCTLGGARNTNSRHEWSNSCK